MYPKPLQNVSEDADTLYKIILKGRFLAFHAGDLSKASRWRIVLHKALTCFLLALLICSFAWYWHVATESAVNFKLSKAIFVVLQMAKVSAFFFVFNALYASGFKIKLNDLTQANILKIEEVTKKMGFPGTYLGLPRHSLAIFNFLMLLNLAPPIYILVSLFHIKSGQGQMMLLLYCHFPEYFVTLFLSYLTYLLVCLTRYQQKRCQCLIDATGSMLLDNKLPDNLIFWKIKRMEELVRHLYHFRRVIQKLYGWHVFFAITSAVLLILCSIGFALGSYRLGLELNVNKLVHVVIEPVIILVFTVVIILAFDRLQSTSKELSKVAFLVQKDTRNELILEELAFLATFAKELTPSFKAGYFKVDRQLLLSCLSAIGTYLIVIIQFNMKGELNG